ncbi:PaaR repeat-containing protein [bacterium]|nr:PaaR repeat-containing protein [bacterium]
MANISLDGATFSTGHGCTSADSLSNTVSVDVFVGGVPVLVSGAVSGSHSYGPLDEDPCGAFHSVTFSGGSTSVFANGISIGRIGDSVDSGAITSGSSNVFCG